jgi:phospholipid/cholesterol/gamma-HCH transport system substrate-binding protein
MMRKFRTTTVFTGGAALIAATALLGTQAMGNDGEGPVELTARFTDASPLTEGNVVKAAGVDVGTIEGIDLDDGVAEVTISLDREALPLYEDASLTITTQDLLGERFVALDTGSTEASPLEAPYVLDEEHTGRVVDLQDVLNSLDEPTSASLAALITNAGEGLDGRGADTAEALKALQPAMSQAGDLAAILNDQNELLARLVQNAEPVAAGFAAGDGETLDSLVASSTQALTQVSASRAALRSTVSELPSTIASARATLAEVAGLAGPATTTLRELRPVTEDLGAISGELQAFADAADPALGSLPAVLDRADELLEQAGPVVRALRPSAGDMVGTATALDQLSERALSTHLGDLMEFVKGWSMATSDYDAVSHYFKAMVPLSPASLDDLVGGIVPAAPDDTVPDLPLPTVPQPDPADPEPKEPQDKKKKANKKKGGGVQDVLDGLLPGLGAALGNNKSSVDPTSVTGLSEQQENNMLDQLLGGLG